LIWYDVLIVGKYPNFCYIQLKV